MSKKIYGTTGYVIIEKYGASGCITKEEGDLILAKNNIDPSLANWFYDKGLGLESFVISNNNRRQ